MNKGLNTLGSSCLVYMLWEEHAHLVMVWSAFQNVLLMSHGGHLNSTAGAEPSCSKHETELFLLTHGFICKTSKTQNMFYVCTNIFWVLLYSINAEMKLTSCLFFRFLFCLFVWSYILLLLYFWQFLLKILCCLFSMSINVSTTPEFHSQPLSILTQ